MSRAAHTNSTVSNRPGQVVLAWVWPALAWLLIISTIFLDVPFQYRLQQGAAAAAFIATMLLTALAIVFFRLASLQIWMTVAIASVVLMFVARLGMAERSHLIEFCVLTLLVMYAVFQQWPHWKRWQQAALAATITVIAGVADETLQLLAPKRIFDWNDIWFNSLAAVFTALAVLSVTMLPTKRKKANQVKD